MSYKWIDQGQTTIQWQRTENQFVVIREGHPLWEEARVRPDIEAYVEPVETVEDKRAEARITKEEFLFGCIAAGILTKDDALAASKNQWPPTLEVHIPTVLSMTGLPSEEYLVIIWNLRTTIGRTNPILLSLQAAMGVTDETLDAIFGIA